LSYASLAQKRPRAPTKSGHISSIVTGLCAS